MYLNKSRRISLNGSRLLDCFMLGILLDIDWWTNPTYISVEAHLGFWRITLNVDLPRFPNSKRIFED